MIYDDWEKDVPEDIKGDALWKVKVYRYGLFVSDLGWFDATKLMQDRRTRDLSDQLYRSLGSISSNIAEGYSRSTGKARAIYFEYALGSARESRDWVYKGRHVLGKNVSVHRVKLLTEIIRLLLTMLPEQRKRNIREDPAIYETTSSHQNDLESESQDYLPPLLTNAPMPDP